MKKNPLKAKYVYIVVCGEYFKLGITDNVNSRLNGLQCGNPYEVSLWICKKISNASIYEEELHKSLTSLGYHHKREWYKLDSSILERIKNVIENYD